VLIADSRRMKELNQRDEALADAFHRRRSLPARLRHEIALCDLARSLNHPRNRRRTPRPLSEKSVAFLRRIEPSQR
jgi:hypothetical protein